MSMMVSFVLSFFPRDVLDETLNLIESVSEDFPSYSFIGQLLGTSRVIHFTETNRNGFIHHNECLITLSDRNGPILVLVSTDFDHTGCLITLSDRNGPILDLVYPILTIFFT